MENFKLDLPKPGIGSHYRVGAGTSSTKSEGARSLGQLLGRFCAKAFQIGLDLLELLLAEAWLFAVSTLSAGAWAGGVHVKEDPTMQGFVRVFASDHKTETVQLVWMLLHVVHVNLAVHLHHSHIVAEPVVIVHLRRVSRLKVALTNLGPPQSLYTNPVASWKLPPSHLPAESQEQQTHEPVSFQSRGHSEARKCT